ncbi:MAG: hypothetical protein ABGX04_11350, partial [Myxococcales bacterium]
AAGSTFSPSAENLAQLLRSLLYLVFPAQVDRFAPASRDLVPVLCGPFAVQDKPDCLDVPARGHVNQLSYELLASRLASFGGSSSSCLRAVAAKPCGRPSGLPDRPGWKRVTTP